MSPIFKIWIDAVLLVAAIILIKSAMTGVFYWAARGGNPTRRPLAQIKSTSSRIALAFAGLVTLIFFALMLLNQFK
jgi:hypothetical protein